MSEMSVPSVPVQAKGEQTLLLVAGSGRSGTSAVSGVLNALGLYVPQPETPPLPSNPRGRFEPQWVIDYQKKLLTRCNVRLLDPDPAASTRSIEIGQRPRVQNQVRTWLREQFAIAPEIVVKDPRSSWLLPMWQEAARALSVRTRYLTMLRHPAEVLGSKNEYRHKGETEAKGRSIDTARLAGWINVALHTEYFTHEEGRAYVRYTDLVSDWRTVVDGVSQTLGISLNAVDETSAARVDSFIDPNLHRVKVTWGDVPVPIHLQDLADEIWNQLNVLADSGGHDAHAEASLDTARHEYEQMYADAYAMTAHGVGLEPTSTTPGTGGE
jgi:hypothetical protein